MFRSLQFPALALLGATSAFAAAISIAGPNAPGSVRTSIAAGNFHTCAIRSNGTLACWGDDRNGNAVPGGTFVEVAAKGNQSCATQTSGGVVCWGYRGDGAASPAPGSAPMQLAVGGGAGCAIGY